MIDKASFELAQDVVTHPDHYMSEVCEDLAAALLALRAIRDELVEALRSLAARLETEDDIWACVQDWPELAAADAALAKAKG